MFQFNQFNFNVTDLNRSLAFYKEALGLEPVRELAAEDNSFQIVYLGDGSSPFLLELTWLRDHPQSYDLGEGEFHLAFTTPEFDASFAKHKAMGCVCFENPSMGLYFIEDPDGYWVEIVPAQSVGGSPQRDCPAGNYSAGQRLTLFEGLSSRPESAWRAASSSKNQPIAVM